jgi:hypothetical protein
VKETVFHVRIPFAPRIHFSASQNRRNPGMLFDLIKCHARLLFMQRERDPQGSILATHEDFFYARELFLELAGETGAQETKQTRNEAAALTTIAKMGLEVFTIKHLQDALGLSYHQVYRMLKGYQNNKGMYQGVLDKCPAVSYIDATVAEDLYGVEVKHREHYFSFDPILYKIWSARSQIWLEDELQGSDDKKTRRPGCIVAPGLHHDDAKEGGDDPGPGSAFAGCSSTKDTSLDLSLDLLQETHSTSKDSVGNGVGVRDTSQNAKMLGKPQSVSGIGDSTSAVSFQVRNGQHKGQKHGGKTAKVSPLPGLLDHREFERVKVPSSKCDVCHEGAAVFRCKTQKTGICERCYTKMVREWNEGQGVR